MTNQWLTFRTLNNFFLTSDYTINTEYLNYLLHIYLFNERALYDAYLINTRIKPENVASRTLKWFVDYNIKTNHPNTRFESTNEQIKKWLNIHGNGCEELKQLTQDIIDYRKELKDFSQREM